MTRITPERAKDLLEGAQPGPWKAVDKYDDGKPRPDTSRVMHSANGEYLGIMHGQDAHLTAAAPDLAETIAGMHYQYLVEAHHLATAAPNTWMPCNSLGLTYYDSIFAGEPWRGPQTWRTLESAKKCAETAQAYSDRDVRIIRRLVTDVEVVE